MIVIDTQVLIWLMGGNPRLGVEARRRIDEEASDGVHVSAITPWEISLLVAKERFKVHGSLTNWMNDALSLPGIRLAALEPAIAIESNLLPGEAHGDPADRIIIATARKLGCPLLTTDHAILAYGAGGHVQVIDASR